MNSSAICQRRAFADRDELDQHQGQKYRERVVGAGFDLQRRADARTQAQALGMHQQKHRGGVGRGHHGADQQRLGPVQVERIFGDRRGDQRRQQHAGGRQHHRRRQHRADTLKPGPQAAIEQDQRQRHRPHQIGGADVVEPQLAGTGIAGQHADEQEYQQQRGAEAQREQARQNAGHHQDRAKQNGYADRIERSHEPPEIIANTCPNTCTSSLSSPQLDANPISRDSGNVPDLPALFDFAAVPHDGAWAGIVGLCRVFEQLGPMNCLRRDFADGPELRLLNSCCPGRDRSARRSPRPGSICSSA